MGRLVVTLACPPYDRVLPLAHGVVQPEGVELNFLPLVVEEVFWRQLRHEEFDCSELSLSSYVMARSRGDDRFIAIPVFTSRCFRHGFLFIHTGKGIRSPRDLRGRRVGVPEYQLTVAVWLRGIVQDDFGVRPEEMEWVHGGLEEPGREEKVPLELPPGLRYEAIGPGKTLSRMLEEGEIDALFTPRAPSCFVKGSPHVARMFPNYREVEEEYFRRTGIFPIMHTVVLRRSLYEQHRWLAMSLLKAFEQAKRLVMEQYRFTAALHVTLPWLTDEVERTERLMGRDWWPYGVEPNRKALETFLRYHHEQGLSARRMRIEELFAPETLDQFRI